MFDGTQESDAISAVNWQIYHDRAIKKIANSVAHIANDNCA